MSGELEEILPANVSIYCNFTQLQGRRSHVGVNRQDQMDKPARYQVSL